MDHATGSSLYSTGCGESSTEVGRYVILEVMEWVSSSLRR